MTTQERQQDIDKIRRLPGQIEALVSGLSAAQLTTHFLASEWTVAQNVHHLADSHMNSYIRCKLILTEEKPPLKPYDQDAWANLPDAQSADLSASLLLLRCVAPPLPKLMTMIVLSPMRPRRMVTRRA